MEENDLRDLENLFAQVEDFEWSEPSCIDYGISSFWRSVGSFAEQKDGERSKNLGKQKKPFYGFAHPAQ